MFYLYWNMENLQKFKANRMKSFEVMKNKY
jgi:hypothetical protein